MIVCMLSDLTRLPLLGGGIKSWYIIIVAFLLLLYDVFIEHSLMFNFEKKNI